MINVSYSLDQQSHIISFQLKSNNFKCRKDLRRLLVNSVMNGFVDVKCQQNRKNLKYVASLLIDAILESDNDTNSIRER
jgi:hypothetical protein